MIIQNSLIILLPTTNQNHLSLWASARLYCAAEGRWAATTRRAVVEKEIGCGKSSKHFECLVDRFYLIGTDWTATVQHIGSIFAGVFWLWSPPSLYRQPKAEELHISRAGFPGPCRIRPCRRIWASSIMYLNSPSFTSFSNDTLSASQASCQSCIQNSKSAGKQQFTEDLRDTTLDPKRHYAWASRRIQKIISSLWLEKPKRQLC
jgi:hypothetical protein